MADVQTSLRSVGWVSLWSLAQLASQVALQIALANYFGASADMDAFVAAMALPTVVSSVIVGPIGYVFVPLFGQRSSGDDQTAAWSAANQFFLLLVLITGSVSAVICLSARTLTGLLYPGFWGAQASLAERLLMILAWLIFANGLIAFTQAVHHAQRRFLAPAAASVFGIATSVLLTVWFWDRGITAAAVAVLAGSFVTAALQSLWPCRHLRLEWKLDEGVRRCLRLLVPLVCGAAYYRLDPLVDRYLASGLPVGSVSHLGYASRVVTALLMISTSGLSIVAFPNFASQYARECLDGLRREVAHAMRCLCIIIIPMLIGLAVYSRPLIRDVFQRGEFTAADARAVAWLVVLSLGLIAGASVGEIASKVLYALSDTRTPTIVGCAGFTLGLLMKLALVGVAGVVGIVAATSTYYLVNAIVMSVLVHRKLGSGGYEGAGGAILRAVCAAAFAVGAVWPLVQSGLPLGSVMAVPVGSSLYLGCLWVLDDEVACRLVRYTASRVMRH